MKILDLALKQVGVKESPAGSKNVKYNTAYYGGKVNNPALAWCAVFIWWLFKECDMSNLYYGGKKTASCDTLYQYYKQKKQLVTSPKAGDIVFYDFNRNGSPDHVGIVYKVSGNSIITIEGNTSSNNQTNGGCVEKKTRSKSLIFALARPKYSPEYKTLYTLNFRKSADLNSEVLDVVPKGTVLSGATVLGGWLKTTFNGKSGYVRVKGQKVYCERV